MINFNGANAVMMKGERGPEHSFFLEKWAELECYSQCIIRFEANEFQ